MEFHLQDGVSYENETLGEEKSHAFAIKKKNYVCAECFVCQSMM